MLRVSSKTHILVGHSQGVKMSAQLVYENPGLVDMLILISTTNPRNIDLGNVGIPVLKVYGSNEGMVDKKSILNNKHLLPQNTVFKEISRGIMPSLVTTGIN